MNRTARGTLFNYYHTDRLEIVHAFAENVIHHLGIQVGQCGWYAAAPSVGNWIQ